MRQSKPTRQRADEGKGRRCGQLPTDLPICCSHSLLIFRFWRISPVKIWRRCPCARCKHKTPSPWRARRSRVFIEHWRGIQFQEVLTWEQRGPKTCGLTFDVYCIELDYFPTNLTCTWSLYGRLSIGVRVNRVDELPMPCSSHVMWSKNNQQKANQQSSRNTSEP